MTENKKLYRSRDNRIIFGVCGGLGKYFDIDSTLIRLVFILFSLVSGIGILAYLVFAIVTPKEHGEWVKAERGDNMKKFVKETSEKIRGLANETREAKNNNGVKIFGVILVVLGFIFLIERSFPFSILREKILWPLAFIALGLFFVLKGSHQSE